MIKSDRKTGKALPVFLRSGRAFIKAALSHRMKAAVQTSLQTQMPGECA
ncbi:hypothetical protein HMPREF0240_02718 [Clostridium sp. D5]|nr:hypothetical protein HMPREF0240_02718 [Clostridium sp. D5]